DVDEDRPRPRDRPPRRSSTTTGRSLPHRQDPRRTPTESSGGSRLDRPSLRRVCSGALGTWPSVPPLSSLRSNRHLLPGSVLGVCDPDRDTLSRREPPMATGPAGEEDDSHGGDRSVEPWRPGLRALKPRLTRRVRVDHAVMAGEEDLPILYQR